MVDKLLPNDPRVTYKTALLNGQTYSYIDSTPPSGSPKATIFLIHGWPDLNFGWRYQIPFLTSLNYRVIAPSMMGYGGTSAPSSPSFYTYKRASDDIAALAAHLGLSSIILGGHDWGGAIVYRIAIHYPRLISALFSVCTPFAPPQPKFVDAKKVLPNFAYQNQLAGPDVEREISGEKKLRQFLNGIFGGRNRDGKVMFSSGHGVHFEALEGIQQSPLLSKEEVDYYVKEYAKNGLQGPLNWYRTSELNFEDEKGEVAKRFKDGWKFEIPVLFVAGTKDAQLPLSMSKGMERWFKDMRREEVASGHWALVQKAVEVNGILGDWLEGLNGKDVKASL